MSKLSVKQQLEVSCSASQAFEVVGPNFINIADWALGVYKSWRNDSLTLTCEGAPAGGRYCDAEGLGIADERIIHYSEENHEISWSLQSDKLPGFVKNLHNDISIEVLSENTCLLKSNISADITGIMGFIMKPLFKSDFTKFLKGFLLDWKAYTETGEVSDAKKREIQKRNK